DAPRLADLREGGRLLRELHAVQAGCGRAAVCELSAVRVESEWARRQSSTVKERDDAAISIQVQLHAGDLGATDRQPGGPTKGRAAVHRVGRWETPRILVRLRHARRLHRVGGSR